MSSWYEEGNIDGKAYVWKWARMAADIQNAIIERKNLRFGTATPFVNESAYAGYTFGSWGENNFERLLLNLLAQIQVLLVKQPSYWALMPNMSAYITLAGLELDEYAALSALLCFDFDLSDLPSPMYSEFPNLFPNQYYGYQPPNTDPFNIDVWKEFKAYLGYFNKVMYYLLPNDSNTDWITNRAIKNKGVGLYWTYANAVLGIPLNGNNWEDLTWTTNHLWAENKALLPFNGTTQSYLPFQIIIDDGDGIYYNFGPLGGTLYRDQSTLVPILLNFPGVIGVPQKLACQIRTSVSSNTYLTLEVKSNALQLEHRAPTLTPQHNTVNFEFNYPPVVDVNPFTLDFYLSNRNELESTFNENFIDACEITLYVNVSYVKQLHVLLNNTTYPIYDYHTNGCYILSNIANMIPYYP